MFGEGCILDENVTAITVFALITALCAEVFQTLLGTLIRVKICTC